MQRLQERTLPSPPISRSNSNGGDENNHDDGTQIRNVVRGGEHIFTEKQECVPATVSQPNQALAIQCNHVAALPLMAREDNTAAASEIPTGRWQERGPIECNHVANSAWATPATEDGSFHSVIKKATQEAIPAGYVVYAPPSVISHEARTTAVKDRATSLLLDADYLRGAPNEHSLHTFPEFQQSVPVKALMLVAAVVYFVLTVYKNHGKDTNLCLNAKELKTSYYRLLQVIDDVMRPRFKGPQFEKMLVDWAYNGMDGYWNSIGDGDNMGSGFAMSDDKQLGDAQLGNEHLGDKQPVDKQSTSGDEQSGGSSKESGDELSSSKESDE
ncbi:hypothetical protein OG21DRAFT_1526017 [Imleria badia]|nr:hypothetical protein OG21DRAFT_1526017 [Imleria badia]